MSRPGCSFQINIVNREFGRGLSAEPSSLSPRDCRTLPGEGRKKRKKKSERKNETSIQGKRIVKGYFVKR